VQTSAQIATLLNRHRFRYENEKELQAGIETLLRQHGIVFEREASLGEAGVIDFLVEGGLGVEVKTKGALTAVTIQVHRYTRQEEVKSLLLVTTRARHRDLPDTMNDTPVRVAWLAHGAFG
jgi:hypothetical protein